MTSREHDRIAKLSAGNFDFSDEEEDSDYEQESSTKDTTPSGNSSDRAPPGYTKPITKPGKTPGKTVVTIHGGLQVEVHDYPISWVGNVTDIPSTHEIIYDTFNDFDQDHCYVTGFSTNQIVRINLNNPSNQQFYRFDLYDDEGQQIKAVPHTVRFVEKKDPTEKGMLWVGLEYAGLIVKVDMKELINDFVKQNSTCGQERDNPFIITKSHFKKCLDVRINDSGPTKSTPHPINTHPHGFCFDQDCENIWFTGKLTGTVGRVNICSGAVKHYVLPTIGSVPIYLSLDADGNVWGTCLANNTVFRVTTGQKKGQEEGVVTELQITSYVTQSRPIAIKKDPREGKRFMWFSNEAGRSICRIDIGKMETLLECEQKERMQKMKQEKDASSSTSSCLCSVACKLRYKPSKKFKGVITEYHIPANHNYIFGGLTFSEEALWVQSYYNKAAGERGKPVPKDHIIRIDKGILDRDTISGVHVASYQVPTEGSILHRITQGPKGNILFTELGVNRFGVLKVVKNGITVPLNSINPTTSHVPFTLDTMDDDTKDRKKRQRTK